MANYLTKNAPRDEYVRLIKKYDAVENQYKSIQKKESKIVNDLGIQNIYNNELDLDKKNKIVKAALAEKSKSNWRNKPLHGQYLRNLEDQPLDQRKSVLWLKNATLKGETESLIVAAQDQALKTRYYENKIIGNDICPKCRLCGVADETIDHIISACPILARAEYIERHDKIAESLHFTICQALQIGLPTKNWYKHFPKDVVVSRDGKTTILWNQQIITDRLVPHNKPDIVLKHIDESGAGMCLIIDVAIPADNNVIKKEAEKILKYRSLNIEIQRMWKMKAKTIPIIISATGNISKNLHNYLNTLPGRHSPVILQKTAIIGTARILRKVLMD